MWHINGLQYFYRKRSFLKVEGAMGHYYFLIMYVIVVLILYHPVAISWRDFLTSWL